MKYGILTALFVAIFTLSASANFFVMPVDGTLYASPAGGTGSGVSEFGTGTSTSDYHALFTGLPSHPAPTGEVAVGTFAQGTSVNFAMKTVFSGTFFAFSNDTTRASARTAYMDLDNSLGMVVQQTGVNTYRLHLDDAASFDFDDNDNDFLIDLRVASVPEPTGLALLGTAGVVLLRRKR